MLERRQEDFVEGEFVFIWMMYGVRKSCARMNSMYCKGDVGDTEVSLVRTNGLFDRGGGSVGVRRGQGNNDGCYYFWLFTFDAVVLGVSCGYFPIW